LRNTSQKIYFTLHSDLPPIKQSTCSRPHNLNALCNLRRPVPTYVFIAKVWESKAIYLFLIILNINP